MSSEFIFFLRPYRIHCHRRMAGLRGAPMMTIGAAAIYAGVVIALLAIATYFGRDE